MSDSSEQWRSRLDQLGAVRDAQGVIRSFTHSACDPCESALIIGDQYAVILVDGDDATTFLQGQLTADLDDLANGHWRLAMQLDLKGRGQFSYLLLPAGDSIVMLTERNRAESAIQALKKYALFSKVHIRRQPDQVALMLVKPAADITLNDLTVPAIGHCQNGPLGVLARLDTNPVLLIANIDAASQLLQHYSHTALGAADHWQQQEMSLGLAHILPGGEGHWLPQMLNYDQHRGVSFNKGCYLGQEVVARMHFKGKLKQRLQLLCWQAGLTAPPGTLLRDADGQAVGELVNALALTDRTEAQVVIKLDYDGELYLDSEALQWRYLDR